MKRKVSKCLQDEIKKCKLIMVLEKTSAKFPWCAEERRLLLTYPMREQPDKEGDDNFSVEFDKYSSMREQPDKEGDDNVHICHNSVLQMREQPDKEGDDNVGASFFVTS